MIYIIIIFGFLKETRGIESNRIECPKGFRETNRTCGDIDECADDVCGMFEKCQNLPGGYICNSALVPLVSGARSGRISSSGGAASTCGQRYARENSRIYNGRQSKESDWPWYAYIEVSGSPNKCGGTFVAANWVLTAHHCLQSPYGTEFSPRQVKVKARVCK